MQRGEKNKTTKQKKKKKYKAQQTEVAKDRLAPEEPEAAIEIGWTEVRGFLSRREEWRPRRTQAIYDFGHAYRTCLRRWVPMDGRKVHRALQRMDERWSAGGQETWTNAGDQGGAHYTVDAAGQRMAVMVRREVLHKTTQDTFLFIFSNRTTNTDSGT
jgi:hypothetical protein